MKLLKGKKIADKILQQLKKQISKKRVRPGLAVILVGQNPASRIYVKLKKIACQSTGIRFKQYLLSAKTSEKKILALIKKINQNRQIHGLIIQLPLPSHLNPNRIVRTIDPKKDVDGFHPKSPFISPTHQAILELLKATKINLKGKSALVITKGSTFAKPLVKILQKKGISTKIKLLDSRSFRSSGLRNIKLKTGILIVMLGWPKFIKPEMIEKNVIIIDVGYNRLAGKAVGDVDPSCAKKTSFFSPVPGGVGPLTVAFLLKNTVLATDRNR